MFQGQRALITGGSSGIGQAIAHCLAEAGARLAIVARGRVRLEAAAAGMRDRGAEVVIGELDVSDQTAVRAVVPAVIGELGGIDLLVNCAGISVAERFVDTTADEFRRCVDVNYLGTVWMAKAVSPFLIGQNSGRVVNVSSVAGFLGVYGYSAYAPTKFAVAGFSEVLRQELKPHGVGVSVVFPPDTDTPMFEAENRTKPAETVAISQAGGVSSPDDVARSVVDGIRRDRDEIYPGRQTGLISLGVRLAPGLVRRSMDRTIGSV